MEDPRFEEWYNSTFDEDLFANLSEAMEHRNGAKAGWQAAMTYEPKSDIEKLKFKVGDYIDHWNYGDGYISHIGWGGAEGVFYEIDFAYDSSFSDYKCVPITEEGYMRLHPDNELLQER